MASGSLTKEEVRERLIRENPLFFFEMNEKQEAFVRVKNRFGRTPARRILELGNKAGKGQPVDEPVLCPGGYRAIGSLKIGSSVYSASGNIATVTGVFNKGVRGCWKFTFDDGSWTRVDSDHLWSVQLPKHRFKKENGSYGDRVIMSTADLIEYRKKNKRYGAHISIPITNPIVPNRLYKPPIDPYFLGVVIGDGCLAGGSVAITTVDKEIVDYISMLGYVVRRRGDDITYSVNEGMGAERNPLNGKYVKSGLPDKMRRLGILWKRSWEKRIPQDYLYKASPAQRLELLCGLMDTDGSVGGRYGHTIEYCTTSEGLASDVQFLVHSLGGKAGISSRITHYPYKGEIRDGRVSYRVRVQMNLCPFNLTRKREKFRPKGRTADRIIRSIEPLDQCECVCIAISDESSLYLTRDCIVTHNTEIGIAEDISYSVGYRCWLPPDDPDHKINVKVPNVGLIACETMMHSVAEKIEPNLRRLIPKTCRPIFKPGSAGILIKVTIPFGPYGEKCGSEIYVRSYDQRTDSFEGIDYTGFVHWDEPPEFPLFTAVERGKVVTNAPSWFTMTPLKSPWVYDLLSSRAAVVI